MALFCLILVHLIVIDLDSTEGANIDYIKQLLTNFNKDNAVEAIRQIQGELQQRRSGFPPPILPSEFDSRTCGPANDPATMNVDLCVIIQTSCHISDEELNAARNIVVRTAERFGTDVSLSLVTYSDVPKVLVPFQENSGKLIERMRNMTLRKNLRCSNCEAATGDALKICRETFFASGRDDRYFPDAIMIFTDGISMKSKFTLEDDRKETIAEALINRREGIITIVSTFSNSNGFYTGNDEWHALNSPSSVDGVAQMDPFPVIESDIQTRAFAEPNFGPIDALDIVLAAILPRTRQLIYTAIPGCSDPCNHYSDIVLIIDRSESIAVSDLQIVLDFFIFFLGESLIESDTGLQFAIYSYNRKVFQHSTIGQYTTKEELIDVMMSIPVETDKFTDTGNAINKAMKDLLVNGRPGSRKTIIIATDGRAWRPGDISANSDLAIKAAKMAKARDIGIYIVGLPNSSKHVDGMIEWSKLASEPINCTIVNMQRPNATFEDLYLAGIVLTNELCKKEADANVCSFQSNNFN